MSSDLLGHGKASSILVERGSFVFAPLVSRKHHVICHLDILLLRPGPPGELIVSGGDLDNRLKTLFDALRVPAADEIPSSDKPSEDEAPFFCLLEEDALITQFRVVADELLENIASPNHVSMVIHVTTGATRQTWDNIEFG